LLDNRFSGSGVYHCAAQLPDRYQRHRPHLALRRVCQRRHYTAVLHGNLHLRGGESIAYADRDSNSYAHTDSYADRDSNRYAYTDSYANCDSNGYAYAHSYANCDGNRYAYTDSYANCDSNSYAYADSYANRNS
jgi:hypothetical protein